MCLWLNYCFVRIRLKWSLGIMVKVKWLLIQVLSKSGRRVLYQLIPYNARIFKCIYANNGLCFWLQRRSGTERRSSNQGDEEESESGTEEDNDDDEDKHAEEHPPPPAMSSWSSDHNYIAVTPEKTSPISASVLNKTCMYLTEGFPHFIDLSLPMMNCPK